MAGGAIAIVVNIGFQVFQGDGSREILELDAAGAITRRYVYGPGIDEPVVMWNGSGTLEANRKFYRADHQGTIIALTDADNLAEEKYSYSSYGEPGSGAGQPIRYTGRRWDAETGLYYYRARYYSPAIGRFLQNDPIGTGDGLNMYAYVANDPMNATDPSGLRGHSTIFIRVYLMDGSGDGGNSGSGGSGSILGGPAREEVEQVVIRGIRLETTQSLVSSADFLGFISMGGGNGAGGGSGGGGVLGAAKKNVVLVCEGKSRVLQGNPNLVGQPGGFSGDTVGDIPVTSNSAAVIPSQFAPSPAKTILRPFIGQISGVTGGGQAFTGVSDVIGNSQVANVRSTLMNANPGALIIELVNGTDEGVTDITITVPPSLGCPQGTTPKGSP